MNDDIREATTAVDVAKSSERTAWPASVCRFFEKAHGREVTLYSLHERSYHADKVGVLDGLRYGNLALDVLIREPDGAVSTVSYALCEPPDFGNNDFSTALCLRLEDGIEYALIHLSKK